MSKIDKLAIQGIRSFGPDSSDQMCIEFYVPLTLILGQNGCGKTSIIESLKYITTGEVPPGCGRGGSFVHDPKMANEQTVRGQIRLLFQSTKNEKVVSTRSLEATQKASKLECKTLDATMTHYGPGGTKSSISSKCTDFQAEMTSLLGVSKPILENVIFCHQEDSNWPLDEGKKVKDKFDAIFNATKYIKCLDTIKKLRTEMKSKVKNGQETLEALRATKQQAEYLRNELERVEIQQIKNKKESDDFKTQATSIRTKMKEIIELEKNFSAIESDLNGKKFQLDSVRNFQKELIDGQTESFDYSNEILAETIQQFEVDCKKQEAKMHNYEDSVQKSETQAKRLKSMESDAIQKMGQLEAAHETHKKFVSQRDSRLKHIVDQNNMELFNDVENFNGDEADMVLKLMTQMIEVANRTVLQKKSQLEKDEEIMQNGIDQLRREEAALDQDIRSNSKQLSNMNSSIQKITIELKNREMSLSKTSLESVKGTIADVQNSIQEEEHAIDLNEIDRKISEKKNEICELELQLSEVKKNLSKMNKQTEDRSLYEINTKTLQELRQKVEFLKKKNSDDFQLLLGKNVFDNESTNLQYELQSRLSQMNREISNLRSSKNGTSQRKTELDMTLASNKLNLDNKEKQVKDFEELLRSVCGGSNLQSAITKTVEEMDQLSKKEADKNCSKTMISGYINKLQSKDSCPLCHRDFSNKDEVAQLRDDLQQKLELNPSQVEKTKLKIEQLKNRHEQLLQLKAQQMLFLSNKEDITNLRDKIDEQYIELSMVNEESENLTSTLEIILSEEEIARKIQPDVFTIDSHLKKIKNLSEEVTKLKASLGNFDCSLSMDELMKKQSEYEKQIKTTNKDIEKLRDEKMQHKEKLQSLNEILIKHRQKELEIATQQQELQKLQDEVTKLESDKIGIEKQIKESTVTIEPVKLKLKLKEVAKKEAVLKKERLLSEENIKVETMRNEKIAAEDTNRTVQKYVIGKQEEQLHKTKDKLIQIRTQVGETEKQLKDLNNFILNSQNGLANQKEKKRALLEEVKIREKEQEASMLKKDIELLQHELKDFEYESLLNERTLLVNQHDKIQKQMATLEGRLEEINKKKEELNNNLNTKSMKNAEMKFKEKLINVKCTDIACSDLNKYYKALYTAIMRFHTEKMNAINRIIRELWRTTYKGNDIDYVEIKTDETEAKGADQRQSYNYRVIMIKNDIEMDMRGRCSAGQKVLASLIIRMALAETFSKNCGILALDEPTTNLDRENIEALSIALLNIVNRRSSQKNFQLIVITHDDEFLHGLTRADYIEYFYKVSRNSRGLSRITKHSAIQG